MKIYKYASNNNEYLGEMEAKPNPLAKLTFLLPAFSTSIKPLKKKEGFARVFTGKKWEYIKDFRGKEVYNIQTKEGKKIDYLGEVKEGYTLKKPKSKFEIYDGGEWKTDDKLFSAYKLKELNMQREKEISDAVVIFNGVEYDADEISQSRISRALEILGENEEQFWVDANNNQQTLTSEDLKEILRLAGIQQTKIWKKYAELKKDFKNE